MFPSWTHRRFRSSRALELKRLHELPDSQQRMFAELQSDADFYGLLLPRIAGTDSAKAVSRQTAELFASVEEPATIAFADASWCDDVIDLLFDGILEIENDDRFVCGSDAYAIVFDALPSFDDETLSFDALRHAEALRTRDVATLTTALYSYNRMPRTRAWASRFPNRAAVLAHLGKDALLEHLWAIDANDHWISWRPRDARAIESGAITWKLYVSPRPEHIRDTFHTLVRVLAQHGGAPFKIGADAAGLLRPDKLVAYFATHSELEAVANELEVQLRGCPAHGVPFTARIDDDGVLSWGADPPDSERALSWLDRESWRLWVAKSLAAAMSIAKNNAMTTSIAPWQFAVERVRRRGVDVTTWAPTSALWSEPG